LIQLDLDYIDRWNLWLDIKIIAKTGVLMLRGGEGFWARMTKYIPARKHVLPIPATASDEKVMSVQVPFENL
jgi:hypothetical protein